MTVFIIEVCLKPENGKQKTEKQTCFGKCCVNDWSKRWVWSCFPYNGNTFNKTENKKYKNYFENKGSMNDAVRLSIGLLQMEVCNVLNVLKTLSHLV